MVLRACGLRDADVLYIQIGSVRLVNVESFEGCQKSTRVRGIPTTSCLVEKQNDQNKTGAS